MGKMASKDLKKLYLKSYICLGILIPLGFLFPYLFPLSSKSFNLGATSTSIASSEEGEYVVVGDEAGKIRLFATDSTEEEWEFEADEAITSVDISSDGDFIIGGSEDDYIYFFNRDDSKPQWKYKLGADVTKVLVSSDGEIVSATEGGNLYIFNTSSYENPEIITLNVLDMELKQNGKLVVALGTGSSQIRIHYFKLDSGGSWSYNSIRTRVITESFSDTDKIQIIEDFDRARFDVSKDNSSVSFGIAEYSVLYSYENNSIIQNYTLPIGRILDVAITEKGKYHYLATTRSEEETLFPTTNLIKLDKKDNETSNWEVEFSEVFETMEISQDDKYLLATTTNKIYLISTSDGSTIWEKPYPGKAEFTESGNYIALACSSNQNAYLIDIENSILIDDLIFFSVIILIVLFSLLAVSIFLNVRNLRTLKREQEKQEKLEGLLSVSNRVSLDMISNVLGVERETLNDYLSSIGSEGSFKVEGKYLIAESEDLSEFIEMLDKEFRVWEEGEKEKASKKD